MTGLLLSVFPGIDLLGRAFEEEGYCVVRGPDVIWGGDVRTFHPPAGVFEGLIGGDPCQAHSALRHLVRHNGHEPRFPDMTPEYVRVVSEAQPQWFLRENVRAAPVPRVPRVPGYDLWSVLLIDAHVGGVQPRERRICFGMREGLWPDTLRSPLSLIEYIEGSAVEPATLASDSGIAYEEKRRRRTSVVAGHSAAPGTRKRSVTAGPAFAERSVLADARGVPVKVGGSGKVKRTHGKVGRLPHGSVSVTVRGTTWDPERQGPWSVAYPVEEMCQAQGLPSDFTAHMPFTMYGKRSVIGNGVPMAMGRAIASAVRRATA